MEKASSSKTELRILRNYFWILLVLWTVLAGSILLWSLLREKHETEEVARIQARNSFEKDLVYRLWAASHGGVYVSTTDKTPPNPYLSHIEERDITTPSGRALTLVNPAYMTRQVHEMSAEKYGLRGHITSLKPIRPANAADEWETKALRAFEQGVKEVSSIESLDNQNYMRLMRPMITEQSCLKCHAEQGYKVGDLRGGISVSVPMAPIQAIARENALTLTVGHFVLWLLGVGGIKLGGQRLKHRIQEHKYAEEQIENLARFPSENPDPVLRIAENGILLYANDASGPFLAKWDCAVGEIVPENWRQTVSEVFATGSSKRVETEHAGRIFAFMAVPVVNAGYANFYGRDITERKAAADALRISESNYHKIFDYSNDAIFLIDPDRDKIVNVNVRACEMLEYSREELLSLGISAIHPNEMPQMQAFAQSVYERGRGWTNDLTCRTRAGQFLSSEISASVIDIDGRSHVLALVRDTTARKLAEEQVQSLAKFPSENPNPVLRVAKNGVLLYANDASGSFLAKWDCAVGEIVPENWRQTVSEVFATGSSKRVEIEHASRTFAFMIIPILDAGYANLYARDITERKQAAKALQKAHDELETRVQERTKEVTRTVEVLQSEVAERKRLEKEVLEISEEEQKRIGRELHDGLQQELVGMTFECQLLDKKLTEKSLPEANYAVRMRKLLNDAIDHTRDITRMLYPVDLESEDLTSALEQLAARVESLFRISCQFTCEKSLVVKRPDVAINVYRIVQEAITNAIKHGEADSISISLKSSKNRITITIRDNGRGLAVDYEGTKGMGLRIMKYRASVIGASLNIKSNSEGPGTVVTFSFESKDNKLL
jgi:PAS domain S-box-containing protein